MGPAWFGRIYNKLETILVEVDTFTSQSTLCLKSSDPSGWESVRGEFAEDSSSDLQQHRDRVALGRCDSPFDPPSHQNFESGNVVVEEQVEEDTMKEDLSASSSPSSSDGETLSGASLLIEYFDGNQTSGTAHGIEESQISNTLTTQKISAAEASVLSGRECVEEVRVESFRDYVSTGSQSTQSLVESFGTIVECIDDSATLGISTDVSNPNASDTKLSDAPVKDNVANMRYSNEVNPDYVINGKPDVVPLDTKPLSGMTFREDPSRVGDNELYALHVRTKKLRSLQRKILDALTTKRIREKEYEQLAIWFGDADMGSDLVKEDSEHKEAIDSKSPQVLESDDSQWELL